MDSEHPRTIGQIAWQTKLLVETFLQRPVGDVLTYAEIKTIIGGVDPQHAGRTYIHSACRILLNQHKTVVSCEANVGYKRVVGVDALGVAVSEHRKIRVKSRKAGKVIGAIEYDTLAEGDRLRWNAEAVQNALLQRFSSTRVTQKLAASIQERTKFEVEPKRLADALDSVRSILTKA